MATTLSDKEIEKIIDSVEFNPDEYDRSAEPHESTTANQICTTQRLLQTSKTTARIRFPMRCICTSLNGSKSSRPKNFALTTLRCAKSKPRKTPPFGVNSNKLTSTRYTTRPWTTCWLAGWTIDDALRGR